MFSRKILKTIKISIVGLSIISLMSCNSNAVEAKLSEEGAAEQNESVNIDVVETTMLLESSTQMEESTEIESSTQEIAEESLVEAKEETQEKTQAETQVETTIQETQQTKAQVVTGTDINGHPYIDPEKYATWEQQPVDMNVLKKLRDERVEKVYQDMLNMLRGNPTEEKLNQIRQIVEEVITFNDEATINEYKKGQVYTYGADGSPIEAPPYGKKYETFMNPSTGVRYTYYQQEGRWISDDGEMALEKVRMQAIRDNNMDSQGNTDIRSLTDEEAQRIAEGIARAMGAD